MKKIPKYILLAIIAVVAVGCGFYYTNLPLELETYTAEPTLAETYFTKQGYVKDEELTAVYPLVSGEITALYVAEGDHVEAGDVLCVVDSTGYENQIQQTLSSIDGYRAQISNLDLEEQQSKDQLIYNKEALQSDYNSITAQENTTNISTDEQIRLQEIVIAQSELNLENAEDDLQKGGMLYENGIISKNEYDQLVQAVDAYRSDLSSQQQQLEIIKSGQAGSSSEYYESARASIEAQIKAIDSSLANSYTGAMKNYYQALIDGCQSSIELLYKNIDDCTITAPVSGEIKTLSIKNANIVSGTQAVAEILSDTGGALEIEVYVATSNLDAVNVGDEVILTLTRSLGDVDFSGTISEIGSEAVVQTTALGVEERRVKVTVIPDSDYSGLLAAGYDVDVKFTTYSENNRLIVPKTAVFTDTESGGDMVFTVVDGAAVAVPVKLGVELRSDYVIESGLSAGDIVIKNYDADGLEVGRKIAVNK